MAEWLSTFTWSWRICVFKLVLCSYFFLKESPISILTCLKKLWMIFHISYFENNNNNNSTTFKLALNQVKIKKLWRYQVLQQVITIICEGNKFYKKLKPIVYFKCSIYLWFFQKIQWCHLKILNLFSKVYFQSVDLSSYFSKRLVLTKGGWVGFESWEPKPQGLTFQNQEPTNTKSNPLVIYMIFI